MITFLLYIFGIALLDSLNPSAIALVIVILLSANNSILRSILYIFGIFVTNFAIGFGVITLYVLSGISWKPDFSLIGNLVVNPPLWTFYAQLVIGLLLIIVPYFLRPKQSDITKQQQIPLENSLENSLLSVFLLGVSITFVEFSTAFPYLGAISSLVTSGNNYITNISILLVYNFIFVLPPSCIVFIYWLKKSDFVLITSKIKDLLNKYVKVVIKYGTILVGCGLCVDALINILQ